MSARIAVTFLTRSAYWTTDFSKRARNETHCSPMRATSRRSIERQSADPHADPIIDPNDLDTLQTPIYSICCSTNSLSIRAGGLRCIPWESNSIKLKCSIRWWNWCVGPSACEERVPSLLHESFRIRIWFCHRSSHSGLRGRWCRDDRCVGDAKHH